MLQQKLRQNASVVPVSINISRSDFEHCDPVEIIAKTCDAHGVRRNLIAVEITETAIISDSDVMKTAINRFHKAGFEKISWVPHQISLIRFPRLFECFRVCFQVFDAIIRLSATSSSPTEIVSLCGCGVLCVTYFDCGNADFPFATAFTVLWTPL